jgi:hypothetical protein
MAYPDGQQPGLECFKLGNAGSADGADQLFAPESAKSAHGGGTGQPSQSPTALGDSHSSGESPES